MVIAVLPVALVLATLLLLRRGRYAGPFRSASGTAAGGEMRGCVDFHEAGAHTGQTGCISGRVERVYVSRAGNAFLDFCQDYQACPFTSVIFSPDRSKFGDLDSLGGKQVELRGPIIVYQGRAEIILHDPQQIRALP